MYGFLALLFFCAAVAEESTIAPGVVYVHELQNNPPCSIHLLTLDPECVDIVPAIAHDRCNSTEKVSDIARRLGAVAAINGGFFDFCARNRFEDVCIKLLDLFGYNHSNTYPVFALKIEERWCSLSAVRAGIVGWGRSAPAFMDAVAMQWRAIIGEIELVIDSMNKPNQSGVVIFTPAYDDFSEVRAGRTEIVVEHEIVTAVHTSGGGTPIPANGYILSMPVGDTVFDESIGSPVVLHRKYDSDAYDWDGTEFLLASTPLLIKDGAITERVLNGTSTFFTGRHPRTAVGLLPDGRWVWVVVEGRRKDSVGMTLIELAEYLKSCGCIAALNLDGGGSSVMVVDGEKVNEPCGREYSLFAGERGVATALIALSRQALIVESVD